MKKALSVFSFLMAVGGLVTAPVANAAITSYVHASDWITAVGGSGSFQLENFDDALLNPGLTITGMGTGADALVIPYSSSFFSPAPQSVLHDVVDSTDVLTITFAGPVTAMGAQWHLAGPGGPGSHITLNLVGGGTETYTDYFLNHLSGGFRGFVSTNPFTSIVLAEGTGCCKETFEMENMKYVNLIPEPETYAMLLAGLGLMGFVARRRQKALAV